MKNRQGFAILTRKVILCVLVLGLQACATTSKLPGDTDSHINKEGLAEVFLYRPYAWFGAGGNPVIFLDDKKKGKLKNKSYAVLYLNPGNHIINAKWNPLTRPDGTTDSQIEFTVSEGKSYYLSYKVEDYKPPIIVPMFMGLATGKFEFSIEDKSSADEKLKNLKTLHW